MLILSSTPRSLRHSRAVLILGLSVLVLAIAWPKLADALNLSMTADSRDTVHGFLFGFSFGLLVLWLLVRARRQK
jgi:hypothetical protein